MSDHSDKLLKRMQSAMDELSKFRTEMSSFKTWMEKAFNVLEDKERQLANLNRYASHFFINVTSDFQTVQIFQIQ